MNCILFILSTLLQQDESRFAFEVCFVQSTPCRLPCVVATACRHDAGRRVRVSCLDQLARLRLSYLRHYFLQLLFADSDSCNKDRAHVLLVPLHFSK